MEAVIHSFNSAVAANDSKRVVALFTPNGTYKSGAVPALPVAEAMRTIAPKRLPWDERMPLVIEINKVVFPKADTARVEATQTDSSPSGDKRTWACVFVLVKVGAAWKISSYEESGPQHALPKN